MWKKIMLCVALITGTAGTGFAQNQGDVNVEFEGLYWFSDLRADAQISGETRRGTEFNLERDTGLGDKDVLSGRFTWYTGPKSRLFFDYMERSYQGSRVLEKQIVFRDTTYDVGASTATDLRFKFAKFGWIWEFINSGQGAFKFGTIVEARAVFSDLAISGEVAGVGQTKSEKTIDFGLPTVGIALDINPSDWANIFLRTSGMYFGRLGYFGDGEAGVKLIPLRNLSISGGYRYMAIEGRQDGGDSFVRFTFKGPFAGASLRF
jgi:hypothetical protein